MPARIPTVDDLTVVWDLEAGRKWKLCNGCAYVSFHPDGKAVVVTLLDDEGKTSIKTLDLRTGKELAKLDNPTSDRRLSRARLAPDGSVVAIYLTGKKGGPLELWLRDARTLGDRGKLTAKGDPDQYGWGPAEFTPDGKRFVVLDGAGNAIVWNVAGQKLHRTIPYAPNGRASHVAISPDGKSAAVVWLPKLAKELETAPDPLDRPQPRISLIDLSVAKPVRVLIAPHGFAGDLAFSPGGRMLALGSTGAVHLFDLGK